MTDILDDSAHQSHTQHERVKSASTAGHNASKITTENTVPKPGDAPVSRKRKADDEGDGHVDKKHFALRPYPPSMYGQPSIMKPLHLLERARLPLCYLDTTASNAKISQQRFFSSDVELISETPGQQPQVLLARLEVDKSLYAVEKVDKGTYAVCKLAHWVKVKDLKGKDAGRLPGRVPLQRVSGNASTDKPETTTKGKASTLDCNASANVRPDGERDTDVAQPVSAAQVPIERVAWQANEHDLAAMAELAAEVEHVPPAPTPRQLFEKLVCQYMETLYLSKTSLAFFAKGPLSRARAAFTGEVDKSGIAELAVFLRSLCIQSNALDKKYREKLPEIMKNLIDTMVSDDEALTKTPQKKKAPRRLNPTRGGIFPLEEDYVQRWWTGDDSSSNRRRPGETAEALQRRRLIDVRLRETLLQIIIMLEALALEASPDYKPIDTEEAIPGVEETQDLQAGESQAGPKAKRAKKPQDLGLALDLLIDKLCIWQSIEEDHASTITPKKDDSQPRSASTPAKSTSSDLMRDFFSEVIIPFYMSRLPQQVAVIGKKLGGHTASPPKQSAVKPGTAIMRKPPKPGEAIVPQKQPRKSLHRIATDSGIIKREARPPSLIRFSSDSAALANVKRERSSTPNLANIPLASPTGTHSRRGSVADFKRLNKRQVDLTAFSAATEAKQKKKEAIDRQVRNAISTLRKPNRGAAVKEIVDFAEKRKAVLVDATPKRVNKYAAMTPPHVSKTPARTQDVVPSSGLVPVTSSRMRIAEAIPSSTIRLRPQVMETPSRGGSRVISFRDVPIDGRPHDVNMFAPRPTAALQATPSKPRTQAVGSDQTHCGIFATPAKNMKVPPKFNLPEKVSNVVATNERSIYSALGWDNDLDDLA